MARTLPNFKPLTFPSPLLLYLLLQLFIPFIYTHERKPLKAFEPPPRPPMVPPAKVEFVDNPKNVPGKTDNYTMSILDVKNITEDKEREHIQEHLEVPMNTRQMTEKELMFHYFQIFDDDKNQMLDGTELLNTVIHHHQDDDNGNRIFTDDELGRIVDFILDRDDKDNDGCVDWYEFVSAKQRQKS